MSTNNLPSLRYPFEAEIAHLPDGVQQAHRFQFNGLLDLNQAVSALNTKIEGLKTTVASTTTNTNTSSQTIINTGSTIGFINDQTALTTYTTQQSDYGNFILLGDTSPIAVTLSSAGSNPGIQLPWFCYLINLNSGLVTVTPSAGTISYPNNLSATSMPIPQNFGAEIAYDGTNFYALLFPVPPQNTPAIPHEWINSYNSSTGVFTQTQPKATDILNPYTAVSATYAVLTTDYQIECTANSFTVTLPTAVGVTGQIYSIKNSGTGTITVATTSSQTIDGQLTQTLTQYDNLMVMSNGANWIIL